MTNESEKYFLLTHLYTVDSQVVHAVGGKIPVLFDGGIRRGTDIFKALALGAKAVLVRSFASNSSI